MNKSNADVDVKLLTDRRIFSLILAFVFVIGVILIVCNWSALETPMKAPEDTTALIRIVVDSGFVLGLSRGALIIVGLLLIVILSTISYKVFIATEINSKFLGLSILGEEFMEKISKDLEQKRLITEKTSRDLEQNELVEKFVKSIIDVT